MILIIMMMIIHIILIILLLLLLIIIIITCSFLRGCWGAGGCGGDGGGDHADVLWIDCVPSVHAATRPFYLLTSCIFYGLDSIRIFL